MSQHDNDDSTREEQDDDGLIARIKKFFSRE